MTPLPGKPRSLWVDRAPETDFPPLDTDLSVDVAVVGGGIVGITAAVLLKRAGRRVAVLERQRVGRQVTGHSTVKVTSLHGLCYANLAARHGEEAARLYGEANQAALERVAAFVAERNIACGFARGAAYTYTRSEDRLKDIEAEVETARRLGLPAALVHETSLPFPIAGAVRFENQAQFDPCRYVAGLADEIPGGGSHLFERTAVTGLEAGAPCRVTTDKGATVTAGDVIVATNQPILAGDYYEKTFPRAHVALATRIDSRAAPDGMFLSIDPPTRSIRTVADEAGRTVLIVVGEGYMTGHRPDTVKLYRELAAWIESNFDVAPDAFEYRWANEDYDSADGLPFVGRTKDQEHVRVATGFNAWGITNGTAAAAVLADEICGKPNPWAKLYDATRALPDWASPNTMSSDKAHQTTSESRYIQSITDLARGEAGLLKRGDEQIGVYKDEQGGVHAVSPVCSHMGCILSWNAAERTWDCPCHGSIFDHAGAVRHGPAVQNLERKAVE